MKPRIKRIVIVVAVLLGIFLGWRIVRTEKPTAAGHNEHGHAEEEIVKGPHGGRMLEDGKFGVEVTIYEPPGVEPQFRVYPFEKGKPVDPAKVDLTITLKRINRTDVISFKKESDYLAGDKPVVEPHSFNAKVEAEYSDGPHVWEYESLEGRVEMAAESRKKAGISVETAGPAKLAIKVELTGKIVPNEEQMTHVHPRFPGVAKQVKKRLGDEAAPGDVLAAIESNESLQTYEIKAELAGTVIKRDITLGEFVSGQEPIFTIADLSTVWADFSVYRQDFPLLREGQTVIVHGGPGMETAEAKISYISPFGSENSQTMLARAVVPNPKREWRPGLFVRGTVITDQVEVPVAVKSSALQTFRDWDVVFISVGNLFEAVPVEIGRRDDEWVEIKSGLKPGDKYAAENSFIVKADVGKSGATHDH